MFRSAKHIFQGCIEALLSNIGGGAGRRMRYSYYKRRLGGCGRNVIIERGVIFLNPAEIFLGNDVWLDNGVMLVAGKTVAGRKKHCKSNPYFLHAAGELHVGNNVHVGPQVIIQAHGGVSIGSRLTIAAGTRIYSLSHHYRNTSDATDDKKYSFGSMVPANDQFLIESPVVVMDDAGVGINCVLLPGAIVPERTWVGVGIILRGGQQLEEDSIYNLEQSLAVRKMERS